MFVIISQFLKVRNSGTAQLGSCALESLRRSQSRCWAGLQSHPRAQLRLMVSLPKLWPHMAVARRPQFPTTLASSLGLHECPHGIAAGLPPERVIQERTGRKWQCLGSVCSDLVSQSRRGVHMRGINTKRQGPLRTTLEVG